MLNSWLRSSLHVQFSSRSHIYTHAHTHTHIHKHTHKHIRTHTHTHTRTHTHTCKHTHIYTHTHTHASLSVDITGCEYMETVELSQRREYCHRAVQDPRFGVTEQMSLCVLAICKHTLMHTLPKLRTFLFHAYIGTP